MLICCPNANHTFEVADDLIGARVRCPECGVLFFAADSNAQIQAATPKPKEASDLAEKLYDGLPPLSVMMALRRQKGRSYDADDFPITLEMTDDDWKALAAYECLLLAAYSLRTSVVVAAVALIANLPCVLVLTRDTRLERDVSERGSVIALGMLPLLLACIAILFFGSRALQKARVKGIVDYLVLAGCGPVFVYFAAAVFGVYLMLGLKESDVACFMVLSVPVSLIAMFDLGRTTFRVSKALHEIAPPEITNRIVEALKYLE